MWISNSNQPFNPFGYQNKNSYLKGKAEYILPTLIYQIQDRGSPNSEQQYWVVPVDENGNENGAVAIKTAGQVMYSYWQGWKDSETAEISDFYPG